MVYCLIEKEDWKNLGQNEMIIQCSNNKKDLIEYKNALEKVFNDRQFEIKEI